MQEKSELPLPLDIHEDPPLNEPIVYPPEADIKKSGAVFRLKIILLGCLNFNSSLGVYRGVARGGAPQEFEDKLRRAG